MRIDQIPKIIWIFWDKGIENAPPIVRRCYETWKFHNPDWEIRLLSNKNVLDYFDLSEMIPDIEKKTISIQAYTSILRIGLLQKYGGVWADSTTYCNQPLNSWISHATNIGFFAFSKPAPDRMIGNWFLATYPGNYLIEKCYLRVIDYWSTREKNEEYFWFHGIFKELYNRDDQFKSIWDRSNIYFADPPHFFLPYEVTLIQKLSLSVKRHIDRPITPMFKLTHRTDLTQLNKQSVYYYLLAPDYMTNKTLFRQFCERIKLFFS